MCQQKSALKLHVLSNTDKLHTSTNLPVLSDILECESSLANLSQKVARTLRFAYKNMIFIYSDMHA